MEIGVVEAARRLQVSDQRVRALLGSGKLHGRRVGGRWLIDEAELVRVPAATRPFSPRMARALIACTQGRASPELRPEERARIRAAIHRLSVAQEPAQLVASWLRSIDDRRTFAAETNDIPDLLRDPRLVASGISDDRARMSAAGTAEGFVLRSDLDALTRDYLLVAAKGSRGTERFRSNVILHVVEELPDRPVPVLMLAANLADHYGAREVGQADRIIADHLGAQK